MTRRPPSPPHTDPLLPYPTLFRSLHARCGPGDHRDRASRGRRGNEILAVDAGALERAEHRAGRDLAVIDRETGDGGGVARAGERAEPHSPAAAFSAGDFHSSGNSSETSMSLFMSGITPSCGPVRWMTRAPAGAPLTSEAQTYE